MAFPLRMAPLGPTPRTACGECTACCSAMGIVELEKKMWNACPHECGKCGIYETRPQSCRDFECLWLQGYIDGDERRRPDKLGLMFLPNLKNEWIIVCWETTPGAIEHEKYIIGQLAKKLVVYCIPHGEPTKRLIFGPPHLMTRVQGIVEHNLFY